MSECELDNKTGSNYHCPNPSCTIQELKLTPTTSSPQLHSGKLVAERIEIGQLKGMRRFLVIRICRTSATIGNVGLLSANKLSDS